MLSFGSGCAGKPLRKRDYPVAVVRFLVEASPRDMGVPVRLPVSQAVINTQPKSVFTEYDVEKVEVVQGELGPALFFQFTPEAARDLYRVTVTNQGRRILTVVNGTPIGAVRIEAPHAQGFILTYVEVPDAELPELAKNITLTSRDAREDLRKQRR